MRRFTQNWDTGHLRSVFNNVRRRRAWFLANASPRQLANLGIAGVQFATRTEALSTWPVLVKVDISPMCNLHCTFCVHARPQADDLLRQQVFRRSQFMSVAQFARLVNEIGGKSLAVSLYYVGDPLVHPDLDEMCGLARSKHLNVHISSNFSFNLSTERLRSLVASGLTHLTVCVDGLQQETYERTRVGGRIGVVLDNLERILSIRKQLGQVYPRVEVQFIKFQHNLSDLAEVARWCAERGVDQFTDYWGNLYNYADAAPGRYTVHGPNSAGLLPLCAWPYFAMQVKYNGDVIPCCYHRVAEQYRADGDARVVGNVFQTSLWQVWHSPAYRQLRRLVADPSRHAAESAQASTFCEACPTIYDTDIDDHLPIASKQQWEDFYTRDELNRVVRRELPLVPVRGQRER